jgi:hypothetical protein
MTARLLGKYAPDPASQNLPSSLFAAAFELVPGIGQHPAKAVPAWRLCDALQPACLHRALKSWVLIQLLHRSTFFDIVGL